MATVGYFHEDRNLKPMSNIPTGLPLKCASSCISDEDYFMRIMITVIIIRLFITVLATLVIHGRLGARSWNAIVCQTTLGASRARVKYGLVARHSLGRSY